MQRHKILLTIVAIVALITGFIGEVIINRFELLSADFYDTTLMGIVEILLYGIVVVILSYHFSIKQGKDRKIRDFIEGLLDDIKNVLVFEESSFEELLECYDNSSKQKILLKLRSLNNKIEAIELVMTEKGNSNLIDTTLLKGNLKQLRDHITGDEWSVKEEYTKEDLNGVTKIKDTIIKDIDFLKVKLCV